MRLAGRTAIVTGGGSGFGAAIAARFAREGAKVVVAGRSAARGQAIASRIGNGAIFVACDVTDEGQIEALLKTAAERFGRVDTLFNNAGASQPVGLEDVTPRTISDMTSVLLSSVILGIKHAIPIMRAQGGGAIINNSSVSALRARNGSPLYAALKASVSHYTRVAGHELGQFGIRVNAISPGAIATPIFWGGSSRADQLAEEDNARKLEKLKRNLAEAVPLRQSGLASDIAYAALYLASDEGRFVTCHDLVVDGGRSHLFAEPPKNA